jgi:hypothetical protein
VGALKEVNIKSDLPTADTAVKRVTYSIANCRSLGYSAIKIIHGYGSTGRGGKIRTEVRAYLSRLEHQGKIRGYIPGEDFSIFSAETRDAFALCDALRQDSDLERSNNGVTIILL